MAVPAGAARFELDTNNHSAAAEHPAAAGRALLPGVVAEAYDDAAEVVAGVTGREALPEACPYTVGQLLTDGFLP